VVHGSRYPQWFGAKAYKNNSDMQSGVDSSAAINKAINMKLTGEVFLPRGVYKVKRTIKVRCGIILTGEPGMYENSDVDSTILVAGPEDGPYYKNYLNGSDSDKYLIRVNVQEDNDSNWVESHPFLGTEIMHLKLRNNIYNVSGLRGMLILGGYIVDNCFWWGFDQAIQNNDYIYSDSKKVTNCTYWSKETPSSLYAFNMGGLGDALIFEHNHISDQPALRLALCNGGSITSNILHGNVLIDDCKAIVFHSNHMESGAQLTVRISNITTMNNFFWKKNVPNLVLESDTDGNVSVVHSSGDMFLFYDSYIDSSGGVADSVIDISEYDIKINQESLLQLNQTYRYWVERGLIGKMYPFGIAVNGSDGSVDNFNDYSHLLSSNGRITRAQNVINDAYVNKLASATSYGHGVHGDITWNTDAGTYSYAYQIVWDKKRKIFGNSGVITWNTGNTIALSTNGVMFHLANASDNGYQAMLRVYRRLGNSGNYTHYVDIPVAGGTYLYDNGYSDCGYRWESWGAGIEAGNTNITSIRFRGINVECEAPAAPTAGSWEDGDIVYNTATSGTTALWMRAGGAWRAR
jgi:hypothetical protein